MDETSKHLLDRIVYLEKKVAVLEGQASAFSTTCDAYDKVCRDLLSYSDRNEKQIKDLAARIDALTTPPQPSQFELDLARLRIETMNGPLSSACDWQNGNPSASAVTARNRYHELLVAQGEFERKYKY